LFKVQQLLLFTASTDYTFVDMHVLLSGNEQQLKMKHLVLVIYNIAYQQQYDAIGCCFVA
jgi:hypothetical protein